MRTVADSAERGALLLRYIEVAEAVVGLSANRKSPHRRELFLDLVCPNGPPGAREHFGLAHVKGATNSSCGVVGLGIMRMFLAALGLRIPEFDVPLGWSWWAPITALAGRHGAHHLPRAGALPGPGCLYYLDNGTARHWRSVIGVRNSTNASLETIDGGSTDEDGYQLIVRAYPELRSADHTDFSPLGGRKPIIEWIDVVDLAQALFADRAVVAAARP